MKSSGNWYYYSFFMFIDIYDKRQIMRHVRRKNEKQKCTHSLDTIDFSNQLKTKTKFHLQSSNLLFFFSFLTAHNFLFCLFIFARAVIMNAKPDIQISWGKKKYGKKIFRYFEFSGITKMNPKIAWIILIRWLFWLFVPRSTHCGVRLFFSHFKWNLIIIVCLY